MAVITTLANVVNCTGIDFQPGTQTRRTLAANDVSGTPTLTDMLASLAITTGGVLTLLIAAPPNSSSVVVQVIDEVSGAVFGQEITADLPANAQFLSHRRFMNKWGTPRLRSSVTDPVFTSRQTSDVCLHIPPRHRPMADPGAATHRQICACPSCIARLQGPHHSKEGRQD